MDDNRATSPTLEALRKEQNAYLLKNGGPTALKEADGVYNDLNRAQIAAFQEQHGAAYLGSINYDGDQRKRIVAGESIYEEYTGQQVCNFSCTFCVPVADEKLKSMIREWNRPKETNGALVDIEAIMEQIDKLQGMHFLWY